jgi:exodeoxyribonuclease VII small subunit
MTSRKKPEFENAMQELEKIISNLESDDLSLDKALSYFEEGVKLMRMCENQLKSAEGRLLELTRNADGAISEKAFEDIEETIETGEEIE